MKFAKSALPLAFAAVLLTGGPGLAQPQTKLVSELDKALVNAIWCSSLFFEESYYYDEDSEDAIYYEDLAFDLGDAIDDILLADHGMREEEVDEIWSIFDDAALDLAIDDEDRFLAQLEACETHFDTLLP